MRLFRGHVIASRKEVWDLRDRLTEIELIAEACLGLTSKNPEPSIKAVEKILAVVKRERR